MNNKNPKLITVKNPPKPSKIPIKAIQRAIKIVSENNTTTRSKPEQ